MLKYILKSFTDLRLFCYSHPCSNAGRAAIVSGSQRLLPIIRVVFPHRLVDVNTSVSFMAKNALLEAVDMPDHLQGSV